MIQYTCVARLHITNKSPLYIVPGLMHCIRRHSKAIFLRVQILYSAFPWKCYGSITTVLVAAIIAGIVFEDSAVLTIPSAAGQIGLDWVIPVLVCDTAQAPVDGLSGHTFESQLPEVIHQVDGQEIGRAHV